MSTTRRRLKETLTGIGPVLRQDTEIAKVQYTLRIFQHYVVTRTPEGESEIEGQQEIVGHIQVMEGERDLATGEVLTLKLSDGRRWQFFANRGDPVSGSYDAVDSAADGIVNDD